MQLYARVEFILGVTILAVITGLVFVAALGRTFGYPIVWSVDLAQLLLIWLCFLGATKALRERAHLGVDMFIRLFGQTVRFWVEVGVSLLSLGFYAILAVQGTKLTLLNMERMFGDSGLSYAWVTMAVPVGCVMLSIQTIANLAQALKSRPGMLVFSRNGASHIPTEL